MTTISEVYFLVRVGSWNEDDLDSWMQDRITENAEIEYDRGYEHGHKDGHSDGQQDMQKEAINAIKGLV